MDNKIIKHTEKPSGYRHLENKDTGFLLYSINQEDQKVPHIIKEVIPKIIPLVDIITDKMLSGGRLFYLGAGTSGRLGIVDASECPPTFGVEHGLVIGLIAGGDSAIRKAVEFAEDNPLQGWHDLQKHNIGFRDVVIGIAASGTTPYVVGGLEKCRKINIVTGCITCNENTPLAKHADFPVEVIVGPEFITGSTRMKAGTAQKLILNMITTAVMVKLGRVQDNKMVDMQLSNEKLVDRGTKMVQEALNISYPEAKEKLLKAGSVRQAIEGNNRK
jgi:N-acetylmuramic acid 6-phosphate etherase